MKQSFAWWSFTYRREVEPEAFLRGAQAAGCAGVEGAPEALWPLVRDLGLANVNLAGHGIERGFNDPAEHPRLRDEIRRAVDKAAANAIEAVVVFSGNRDGRGDAGAIAACVDGLGPVAEHAAAAGVTLVLELLNSKVDHPDYHCDRTAWGAAVVEGVGSPALRLLFDAYHMQIMEGDLSRTLKERLPLIGHFHTAGVPGRRDLDDRQEVNWRGLGGLLEHLGYDRWVGHEFVPRGEPLPALAHACRQFEARA